MSPTAAPILSAPATRPHPAPELQWPAVALGASRLQLAAYEIPVVRERPAPPAEPPAFAGLW